MADEWEQFKRKARPLPPTLVMRKNVAKKDVAKPAALPAPVKKKFVTLERVAPSGAVAPLRVTRATPPPVDDPELLRRLQRGALRRDAALDLHHMTESEAHKAVTDFLVQAVARGWRTLLIITGRGAVLRAAVPRWLVAQHGVRFFHPAARAHGGDGALYVVLRRAARKGAR